MKKLLTLDDLVAFCEAKKLYDFNAHDTGYKLRVQTPAKFNFEEDDEESSMLIGFIQTMHTGRNRNGSNLTEAAAKEAMKTMAYKPLLANFCEIDGVKDFTQHDFIKTKDGEYEYQEFQVGCFTADEPYMKDDEEVEGRKNIFAKVAIPREYTDAAEIIERKGGTDVSAELAVSKMSYDSKNKELLLESVELIGCTCLGVDPETGEKINPGMENAHIQLTDFSEENNCANYNISDEIKLFIQETIKESLDNIQNSQGKEENSQMNKFEELLAKYGKTAEEIEFEYEGLDDEALEKAFAEAFDGEGEETPDENNDPEPTDDGGEEEGSEDEDNEEGQNDNFATLSVTVNGETKTFSASLIEKLNALYTLVNETYSESDNDYYDVDADEENKEVFMHGWFSGKHYKQKYSTKKDTFSLQGDRVSVYAKYLTEDEIKQLDAMKANYAEIESKLSKFESEPEKVELLNSDDYSQIKETEEYAEISKRENYFELDKEDLAKKLDDILLSYAKKQKIEFSSDENQEQKIGFKRLPVYTPTKRSRYGGLGKTKTE